MFLRLLLILGLAPLAVPGASAQDREARNRDIYLYRGADREQRLVSQAKKEGGLTLYSTMTPEDVQAILPGVAVHRLHPAHDATRRVDVGAQLLAAVPIP